MDSYKIEREEDADNVAESEMVDSISRSSSEDENSRNRRGIETKNKMKLRSFKLSRLPSLRSYMRPMKSQSRKCQSLLSDYAASSEQSTPVLMPDASPNYTKATSNSDASKETFQKSERILTRRSSMKFTMPSTRKSSGGTDQKKKLKKTRSIKLANFGSSRPSAREESDQYDQPSVTLSRDVDTSERYSKAHFQASPHSSESSYTSTNSDSSVRGVKGTTALRPQRILTKTISLKSKKASMKKRSEVSEISESSVDRATCSSTLKDSKFPHHSVLHPGGSESEGIQAMKVCTYSYCSLHGHHHGSVTPLKRFVSMRRRLLKTQKSMKSGNHSVPKVKHSRNRIKGVQVSPVTSNGYSADQQTTLDCGAEDSVTEAAVKDKLKATDSQGRENRNIGDSLNFSEEPLDESLHPAPSFEQHKSSNPLTAKQQTQGAISASQETSEECRCITTEPVEVIPEATDTEKKAGEIVGSGAHNGDDKPILTVDHRRIKDSSLQLLKGSFQCDNQSSDFDDVMSSSHEEVPVDAKVHKEVNGDAIAHLNLEASTTTRVINEGKNEDSGPDKHLLKEVSRSGDSTPDCTTDQSQQTKNGKPKYMGLWGLIYQHMVSGINAEVETEVPCDGEDKEQFKDKRTMTQMNDSVSCHSSTESDEDKGIRDHDAGETKFKPWQSDVIKQVQEAFDKILSEIPDQSSSDQLITSDLTSGQEALKNNHCKGGQQSISSSIVCTKENIVQDQEDAQLGVNINTTGEEEAESRVGNKSSQQISKNWSNLKKVIILKRFVRALEKVNKFNPRKPRCPTLEPDPLGQKIHLRHQTVEERKKADEWMLDSALRQVISTLAPAQKRKVALLVQAFETITPPEISTHLRSNAKASSHATPVQECTYSITQRGEQNNSGSLCAGVSSEMSFEKTMDQVSNFSAAEGHIPGTCSVPKRRSLRCDCSNTMTGPLASETTQKNLKEEDSVLTDDQPGFTDISSTSPEEPRLSSRPDDSKSTFHEKFQVGGKIILEVTKEVPLIYDSEFHDCDTKFDKDKLETGNLLSEASEQSCLPKSLSPEDYGESVAVSSVASSTSLAELLEDPMAASREEANTKYEVLQKFSALEASEPCDTIDMAQESKLEKQKYTRLWYLIYKHMVSSSTEVGPQPLLEEARKEEQGSNANALLGMKDDDSGKDFVDMNHKLITDNHKASSQKMDRHQIEAIKIIEEAIDEIPLPDIQDDSPHDPSITGNMLREQELQKKHGTGGELFISTSNDSARDSFRESNDTKVFLNATAVDPRETRPDSNNITAPAESETFSKSENKSKPQLQKSWSNLKKVILLKRFIKSLEKVRKFNPREPRYLPFQLDTEAETVHLRHQNTQDRKNAEEWMLDYALQQVVAKLTPARKRKVELLVEAFETVTPMLEVKSGQRVGAVASPGERFIQCLR